MTTTSSVHGAAEQADREILAGFWHPVAYSADVSDEPVGLVLLDERLVIYRTDQGLTVARDLCLHRGTQLSRGWIHDNQIVCPFHGLHYDATGRCTRIPAQDPETPISPKLCLTTYPVVERYGLIWTCLLGEPRYPIPDWSPLEDPAFQPIHIPDAEWEASAARHVENFNDLAHLSWVHAGTFGDPDHPRVENYEVEATETGLRQVVTYVQVNKRLGLPPTPTQYTYEFNFPFASSMYCYGGPEVPDNTWIFDVASPTSARTCKIFMLHARPRAADSPDNTVDDVIGWNLRIIEEDRSVVETQRPEELPLDLRAEINLSVDRFSVAYRRKLAEFGLSATYSA